MAWSHKIRFSGPGRWGANVGHQPEVTTTANCLVMRHLTVLYRFSRARKIRRVHVFSYAPQAFGSGPSSLSLN